MSARRVGSPASCRGPTSPRLTRTFAWPAEWCSPNSLLCSLAASPGARTRKRAADLCPASQVACEISASVGFECIDPTTNLEQCGGCLADGTGVDCTAIHGAESVSCEAGRCIVSESSLPTLDFALKWKLIPPSSSSVLRARHVRQLGFYGLPLRRHASLARLPVDTLCSAAPHPPALVVPLSLSTPVYLLPPTRPHTPFATACCIFAVTNPLLSPH